MSEEKVHSDASQIITYPSRMLYEALALAWCLLALFLLWLQ